MWWFLAGSSLGFLFGWVIRAAMHHDEIRAATTCLVELTDRAERLRRRNLEMLAELMKRKQEDESVRGIGVPSRN